MIFDYALLSRGGRNYPQNSVLKVIKINLKES